MSKAAPRPRELLGATATRSLPSIRSRSRAGEYECLYGNLPPFGLARATKRIEVDAAGNTAYGRLKLSDGSDSPEGTDIAP